MGHRLEAAMEVLFYVAAAVLIVVLPLHLLEHIPANSSFSWARTTPHGWVLWLLLIFAGIHGPWGLRKFLYDYVSGARARTIITFLCILLSIVIISVGAYGLARVYPLA